MAKQPLPSSWSPAGVTGTLIGAALGTVGAAVEIGRRLPGWLAADDLLRLLAVAPGRIKQCAHEHCVLWFHDTSKNGTRRWHSMTTCGNRAKARRHYARTQSGGVDDG